MRQFLWLTEVCQIFMVGEQGDGVTGALEVVAPVVQSVDDGEQFLIVDIIVSFSSGEHLREIGARMQVTLVILLHQYPPLAKREASVMMMKG